MISQHAVVHFNTTNQTVANQMCRALIRNLIWYFLFSPVRKFYACCNQLQLNLSNRYDHFQLLFFGSFSHKPHGPVGIGWIIGPHVCGLLEIFIQQLHQPHRIASERIKRPTKLHLSRRPPLMTVKLSKLLTLRRFSFNIPKNTKIPRVVVLEKLVTVVEKSQAPSDLHVELTRNRLQKKSTPHLLISRQRWTQQRTIMSLSRREANWSRWFISRPIH